MAGPRGAGGGYPVVTIDGPAGAGKSTVARRLAERLGYAYLSSGAIYRAVAWRVGTGMPVAAVLRAIRIEFPGGGRVVVDGQEVADQLYAPSVGERAAELSRMPEVRAFADTLQRAHAARGPLVIEGRDAGTVVFPEAAHKFYLDASLDARARRRLAERRRAGEEADLDGIRAAIHMRDVADRTRAVAPLSCPHDATYVDSSAMTVDAVVERMAEEVERTCSTRS